MPIAAAAALPAALTALLDPLSASPVLVFTLWSAMAATAATLRSLTQGRGTAAMEPDEYQPLPASLALAVEEKRKKQLEERKKAK